MLQFIQFIQETTPLDLRTIFHITKQLVYSAPLKYTGVKIWNKIPDWIKTKSCSQFLKHLNLYLQGN